jgi:hypothetical protein
MKLDFDFKWDALDDSWGYIGELTYLGQENAFNKYRRRFPKGQAPDTTRK